MGVDPRIINKEGKTAVSYLKENPQLMALYDTYGDGIWAAIETNNVQETHRLIKGNLFPVSSVIVCSFIFFIHRLKKALLKLIVNLLVKQPY